MTQAAVLDEDKALWFEDALATIRGLAAAQEFMTADDFRKHMRPAPNVYWPGLVFGKAKRLGIIEPVNTTTSKSRSRNYGSLKTWTRANKEATA